MNVHSLLLHLIGGKLGRGLVEIFLATYRLDKPNEYQPLSHS